MRWKLRAICRYCPRLSTLVVLAVIATLLVLANLSDEAIERGFPMPPTRPDWSFDVHEREGWSPPVVAGTAWGLSYGWPLLWHQYVIYAPYGAVVVGGRCSTSRLAADIAMWLIMLAAPGGLCEWMLRRYRPKLRWSLRTMLTAVSLVAMFLGWFVWARDRADREDALTDAIRAQNGEVWFERWGPKWLDLVGADRYRRRIVAATVRPWAVPGDDGVDFHGPAQKTLQRLSQLPNLKYLFLDSFDFTPDVAEALCDFPHLRMLSIDSRQEHPEAIDAFGKALRRMPELRVLSVSPGKLVSGTHDEFLVAIANATQLETLHLSRMTLRGESLTWLAALTNLKALSVEHIFWKSDEPKPQPVLKRLPQLAHLEAMDFEGRGGVDLELHSLARLPKLKSLRLTWPKVMGTELAKLAWCPSLEELSLCGNMVQSAGLESLLAVKRLDKLHIDADYKQAAEPNSAFKIVPRAEPEEVARSLRALQALRNTHPSIIIDGDWVALRWHDRKLVPSEYDTVGRSRTTWLRELVHEWKEAGRPPFPPGNPKL